MTEYKREDPRDRARRIFNQTSSKTPGLNNQPDEIVKGEVLSDTALTTDTSHGDSFTGREDRISLAKKTNKFILESRSLLRNLVMGDDESKSMVVEYLREEIELQYLQTSIKTDEARMSNLVKQIGMVNQGLGLIIGKETSMTQIYKKLSSEDPEKYKPLFTEDKNFSMEGFFAFMNFHKELVTEILSASEIASESAEIKAQETLIPLREELKRMKIREEQQTAIELREAKADLVEGKIAEGEILGALIRGKTAPIIMTLFEMPVLAIQGPVERLNRWMEESIDKGVPISAVLGAVGGAYALFTTVAASSPIISSWLANNVLLGAAGGVFSGALLGAASWLTLKNLTPVVRDVLNGIRSEIENLKNSFKKSQDKPPKNSEEDN